MFTIHVGRKVYRFATLEDAVAVANEYFRRTGVVLGIERKA